MDVRTGLCRCVPKVVGDVLASLSDREWNEVQEIRLRAAMPLVLSRATGDRVCDVTVSQSQVRECFLRLCDQAVHTHQEELRQGFITTREGLRVGVAGTAVMRDGTISSYRDITSLCIRLPHCHRGCATSLLPYIETAYGLKGMLLCGAPSCGKTTLLRDLAYQLARTHRVSVIDERRELSVEDLRGCDVLCGCPKANGILQAVRTLSPDAVIADEIGDEQEWNAVAQSVFYGVSVIASVHAHEERELLARPYIREVLKNGGFEWLAFLPPRRRIGDAVQMRKAADLFEVDRDFNDDLRVCGNRVGMCQAAV